MYKIRNKNSLTQLNNKLEMTGKSQETEEKVTVMI